MSTSGDITTLRIERIRRDGATQLRTQIDDAHVQRLIEALESGATLPPITVYRDDDGVHWLADGWHRLRAHQALNRVEITAEVRSGSRRDAILHAAGANAAHGLPRSRADVRRAIEALLRDEEWRQWSDREIARRVGCSHHTVASVRRDLESSGQIAQIESRRAERNGVVYTVSAPAQEDRSVSDVVRLLRQAENCGPTEGMRLYLLDQAEKVIDGISDQNERKELSARMRALREEAEQARRSNDQQWLKDAREWLKFAENEEGDERRQSIKRAQDALWRVFDRNSAEWRDLHQRSVALQTQEPVRTNVVPEDIKRRCAKLGYRCIGRDNGDGTVSVLIWRDGERKEGLEYLNLDEARDWLDWAESLAEDNRVNEWRNRIIRLLEECDRTLLSVLSIVFPHRPDVRGTLAHVVGIELTDAAVQRNRDALAQVLYAEDYDELEHE